MLQSFFVENFRAFRTLSIERMGRVNLIVGRNNSGKTALLEAIELFVSDGSPQVFVEIINNRQEGWKNNSHPDEEALILNPIRHLFHGHELAPIGEPGITIGPITPSSEQLQFSTAAYRLETNGEDLPRRVFVEPSEFPFDFSDLEIVLVVRAGGKIKRTLRLDRDLEDEARRYRRSIITGALTTSNAEVVPTRNMTEDRLATLWDQINLTGLDHEVIEALKILDSDISGVAFVEDSSRVRRHRIPIIKLKSTSEPFPLKTMGDGMTRILHIVVALVNAKNGVLLVDEFENGLHWTVQPKIWSIIFRLAQQLNVQVFATTHSRDCVRGYQQAWNQCQDQGAFFRLNMKATGIDVTAYSYETLADALETDVEIR
jgi:ABC-type dipeptide/oligopeptide/nickel transport system ATPase component